MQINIQTITIHNMQTVSNYRPCEIETKNYK